MESKSSCAKCGRCVDVARCMCTGLDMRDNDQSQEVVPGWCAKPSPKQEGYWHPKTGWTKYASPALWGLSDHGLTPWHPDLINKHEQPLYRAPRGGQYAEGFTSPFPDPAPGMRKPMPWTAEAIRHRQQIHDCCAPPEKHGTKRKREPLRKAQKETRAAKLLRVAAERVRGVVPVISGFTGPPRPGPWHAWNGLAWVTCSV